MDAARRAKALVLLDLMSGGKSDEVLATRFSELESIAGGATYLAGFTVEPPGTSAWTPWPLGGSAAPVHKRAAEPTEGRSGNRRTLGDAGRVTAPAPHLAPLTHTR